MVEIVKTNHWNQAEVSISLTVDAPAAAQISFAVSDQIPLLIGGVLLLPLSAEGKLVIPSDASGSWVVHGRLLSPAELGEDFRNGLRERVAMAIRDSGVLGDQGQFSADQDLGALHGVSEGVIDAVLESLGHAPLFEGAPAPIDPPLYRK